MATDGSMAVWSEHRNDAAEASAEVHFNYWLIRGHNTVARDFVEIGILVRNAHQVERIQIYLPGSWNVEDCAPRFADPNVAQGIFNEQLTAAVGAPPGPQRVEYISFQQTMSEQSTQRSYHKLFKVKARC
jgi:hypothetical protein